MKVRIIVTLSLASTLFSCLAFKSQPNVTLEALDKFSTIESNIHGGFYSKHKAMLPTTIMGTCNTAPVPGCFCPFCTILRSQK
ncbi:hypothetical protein CCZ08_25930 [Escherichia coli]|nr:hypothetical protein CCZ11_25900 [Escherichia coli]RAX99905.1 hypothetical protein CCZ08_25930 [Escherichia coli]